MSREAAAAASTHRSPNLRHCIVIVMPPRLSDSSTPACTPCTSRTTPFAFCSRACAQFLAFPMWPIMSRLFRYFPVAFLARPSSAPTLRLLFKHELTRLPFLPFAFQLGGLHGLVALALCQKLGALNRIFMPQQRPQHDWLSGFNWRFAKRCDPKI